MTAESILELLSALETVIEDTPEAMSLFSMVKSLLTNGTEPTTVQWEALSAMLAGDHARLQTG